MRLLIRSIVAAILLVLPQVAMAASSGGHGPAPIDFTFISSVINFVLFLALLVVLLRKPTGVFLRARKLDLEALVERVQAEQNELATRTAELEAEIARFDEHKAERKVAALAAAEREAQKIIDAAKDQAEQMLNDAGARAEMLLRGSASGARDAFVSELMDKVREQVSANADDALDPQYASLVVQSFSGRDK